MMLYQKADEKIRRLEFGYTSTREKVKSRESEIGCNECKGAGPGWSDTTAQRVSISRESV